jgi:hypothetical protein
MRILVFGRIVRVNGLVAVCSVEKYEFRTQSRKLQSMPDPRNNALLQRWVDGLRRNSAKMNMVLQA